MLTCRMARCATIAFVSSQFTTAVHAKIEVEQRGDASFMHITVEGVTTTKQTNQWGDEYRLVHLQGVSGYEAIAFDAGTPSIPVIRMLIDDDERIAVIPDPEVIDLPPLDLSIYPSQLSLTKAAVASVAPFAFRADAYAHDYFLPTQVYTIEDAGRINGVKRQLITLFPYQYRATTGAQRLRSKFTIIRRPNRSSAKASMQPSIVFVVRSDMVSTPSLQLYLEHKQKLGYATFVETISRGVSAQSIRQRLKSHRASSDHKLESVILIGDIEDIPSFESSQLAMSFIDGEMKRLSTDHHFTLLDQDDVRSDQNGPDVFLGRLSARSRDELDVMFDKLIRYERGEFQDDDWLRRASFIVTDDPRNYALAESTMDYAHITMGKAWRWISAFPSSDTLGGDRIYASRFAASTDHILDALREGRGFINYTGHGHADQWESPRFAIGEMDQLDHPEATPVVISNACNTGQFSVDTAFAESWQRHKHGSVLFWGSIDNTFWEEDDLMQRALYRSLSAEATPSFGALSQAALSEVWRYYGGKNHSTHYWETYATFGDPTIQVRTDKLRQPVIRVDRANHAAGSLQVHIADQSGQDMIGARVVVHVDDGASYVMHTDRYGSAVFTLGPESLSAPQRVRVVVAGANLRMSEYAQ